MEKFKNIEFYATPSGEVMIKPIGLPVRMLTDNYPEDRQFVESFLEHISIHFTDAYKSLCGIYSKGKVNRYYYEFQIVSRFIRCNFSNYDTKDHDIDEFGRFNFEQVQCPLRGECKLENVCCNPTKTTSLSFREIEVLRLIVNGSTTDEIADALFISPNTVNAHRRNIHTKTSTTNVAELVNYWHNNNMK